MATRPPSPQVGVPQLRPSSFIKQPAVDEDDPGTLQESLNFLTTEPDNGTSAPENPGKLHSRARRLWLKAYLRVKGQRALEKVNAGILNYGTNELVDGEKRYKDNLDELLERKAKKTEKFRSADSQVRIAGSSKWLFYPNSKFRQVWTACITFVLVYVAIVSPYRLAFMEDVYFDGWTMFDFVLNGMFCVDILVNFMSCYVHADGTIEDHRGKIALRYLRTWFFIDLISSVPFNLVDIFVSDKNSGSGYNNAMRLARLPRLYRLFRLARVFKALGQYRHTAYFEKLQDCLQINSRLVKLSKFLIIVFFCVHFMGCLWFFSAKLTDFEPDTWVVRCNMMDEPAGYQYIASIYWAVTTTVTVGYGDITARTELEMVLAIMWMFVGVGFYSFTVGSLSSFLTSIDTRDSLLSSKMAAVQEFAKETGISQDVKIKVRDAVRYYTWKMGSVWSDKHSLFSEIPRALQFEVAQSMYGGVVKELQFFQGRGRSFILYFMPIFKPFKAVNGQYLYKEGDFADEMYFITKGRVNLVIFPREIAYKSYLRGSYIGEIEIVRLLKRIDNAQVFGDSEFLAVSKADFLQALDEFPVEAKDVQHMAAERFKRHHQARLETIELLKLKKQLGSLADIAGKERLVTFTGTEEQELTVEEYMKK